MSGVNPQLLAEANAMLATGRAHMAFELLSQDARQFSTNWELAFITGQAGLAAGQPLAALEWLEAALKASPSASTHYYLGLAQFSLDLKEHAERNLARTLQLEPKHWQAHYHLALLYEARGDMVAAEGAYRNSIALNGQFPDALNNLANALRRSNRVTEATALLRRAIEADPYHLQALFNLAQVEADALRFAASTELLERALQVSPADLKLLKLLAKVAHLAGNNARAAEAYRQITALDPADKAAGFVGDFLEGVNRPQPPEDFVVQLMDNLAPRFDRHLVEKLEYRAPELIGRMLTTTNAPASLRILDLGCGTGLVGQHARTVASRIVGVDLAPGMLEVARTKRVYDELVQDDMQRYLERCATAEFDTIIAADAFVYVGDLCGVFDEVSRVLASGPGFIFSIEAAPDLDAEYQLQSTGRYCHGQRYIERLASERGLKFASIEAIPLRLEKDQPVQGAIIQLTKLA